MGYCVYERQNTLNVSIFQQQLIGGREQYNRTMTCSVWRCRSIIDRNAISPHGGQAPVQEQRTKRESKIILFRSTCCVAMYRNAPARFNSIPEGYPACRTKPIQAESTNVTPGVTSCQWSPKFTVAASRCYPGLPRA